ncbi:MAG: flavin reductase family protein [Sphingomonadales bacterium]
MQDALADYRISGSSETDGSRPLRDCLGHFATGVAVVTTLDEAGGWVGLTVNSFTSVSLDPPLILWCLERSSDSRQLFTKDRTFAVNVLAADQLALARRFSDVMTDRFEGVETMEGQVGLPLLAGAAAIFECAVEEVHDGGDHIIILARVKRSLEKGGPALMFHQGAFRKTD